MTPTATTGRAGCVFARGFAASLLLLGMIFITAPASGAESAAEYTADYSFTLETAIAEGKMVFIGKGGTIDDAINPDLVVTPGSVVQINLVNGDGATHDIALPEFDVTSEQIRRIGASTTIAFRVGQDGRYDYFCTLPGHRAAGMEGQLVVGEPELASVTLDVADIVRKPSDLPPPIQRSQPARVNVSLESIELEGRLADGTSYRYWTFNGQVPGPFVRVRVGDTVTVSLENRDDSSMIHSVDFHAVTGPGGGATHLQVPPGDKKSVRFKALSPGLYVYHCATPLVAHHIANGMYGLILVEPEEGLPAVDHEFYIMQGEIYTDAPLGELGRQEFSLEKLLDERPEYFVFNGAVASLTGARAMQARTGDKIRVFFGVGGPNYTSSFHLIGEIFDTVHTWGSVTGTPDHDLQTVSVPPGGAVITEFGLDVPGRYIFVDHALSRVERGLVGFLEVTGPERHEIYQPLD